MVDATGTPTVLEQAPAAHAPADPGMAHEELSILAPVYPLPRPALARGRGAWVRDREGKEYLDFVSGIAVNAFGHCPPGLRRAVTEQMKVLGHCSNLYAHEPGIALAQALTHATGYARAFFCNSGTEAIEAALKFARARANAKRLPGRGVLAFQGGFHGRTAFALAATHTPSYREPFEPLVPGVRFAPFDDLAALDAAWDPEIAAVLVEPVQGEGGVVPASQAFLESLAARCKQSGATLIFDEVQCGMGRSGRLLASEHYGIRPDMTVLSKALGGGIPLAAVLMTEECALALAPGMHGCTFGGNPVATAAGLWVLKQIDRPAFLARVRSRAQELAAGLEALAGRHATLAGARGLGLLRAIVVRDGAPYDPPALVRAARARGLLLIRGGERAVRVIPPLTVTRAEIAEGLLRLDRAVTDLEGGTEVST